MRNLMPIIDRLIDDDSLVENVFGPAFCVVDETGRLLTTVQNQNLLRRAKMLAEQRDALGWEALVESLWALRGRAEIVTQLDYYRAVRREILFIDADNAYDYSLETGSLAGVFATFPVAL